MHRIISSAVLIAAVCWPLPAQARRPASRPTAATRPAKSKKAAATSKPTPATKPKPQTLPMSFKDASMDAIAKFLNGQFDKPVIVSKDVANIKITLVNPKTLPKEEALDILAIALIESGVAIDQRERTIHLIPIAKINLAKLKTVGPDVDVRTLTPKSQIVRKFFSIKHHDPANVVKVLEPLKPDWARMTVEPKTSQIIVVATVEQLGIMTEVITKLDRPDISAGELRVFHVRHVAVYEIMPVLEKLISAYLGKEIKSVSSDRTGSRPPPSAHRGGRPNPSGSNRTSANEEAAGTVFIESEQTPVLLIPDPRRSVIVVSAPANVLTMIEGWLKELDQPRPPSAEHEIVEVQYGDAADLTQQLTYMINNHPDESLRTALKVFPFPMSRRLVIVGSEANRKIVKDWLKQIDVRDTGVRVTRTFTLDYADAQQVAENIEELFGETGPRFVYRYYGRQGGDREQVTVTANTRRNSVTVVASPEKMERIAEQIHEWDKPLEGDEAKPRIYTLKYADPEKTKELLENLFTRRERQRSFWEMYFGGGEGAPVAVGRLFGQFRFEAYRDTGKLIVYSKNEENYSVIDAMLREIDSPEPPEIPRIYHLKFADAESLAEQLNALLNAPGTAATILRRGHLRVFSQFSDEGSPYARARAGQPTQRDDEQQTLTQMRFWWQTPPPNITVKQPSNLIGRLRIVPNVEQNLLIIAAPEEYADAIEELIHKLDKPGLQVLVKAVIAEITHEDNTSLGFRFSTDPTAFISGESLITENALRGLLNYQFTDTYGQQHELTLNVDVNGLLSLLRRVTDLTIKSEPKILTADNVEAEFFDGQDVPFISESQFTEQGQQNQTFDYFPVGIRLRVRPHITAEHEVDLVVNLLVSNIIPGRTLFGGAIVDRRETTTRIVLKNGETYLISGILREEERELIRGIPGLCDIPILGELFKHRELATTNSELLIFLTPYVIAPTGSHDVIQSEPLERMKKGIMGSNDTGKAPQTQPAKGSTPS